MEKKIILITGASSGIGRETAFTLAKQGHKLIIHGRDPQKTKDVFDEIVRKTENNDIEMVIADLSVKSDIQRLANDIAQKYDHLDVLINNAGAQFGETRLTTSEGHERTFAINTLAPFLLSNLLLPLLKKSKSARIVTVSSASYVAGGNVDFADIEFEKKYSLTRSYGLTKRYVWWIMREMAHRLENDGIKNVTVNVCEPGSTKTSLARESSKELWFRMLMFLWQPMMWSIEKAAATSIYLATSPEVEGISGKFYGNCKELKIKDKFIDDAGQKGIWAYCEKICEPFMNKL